MTGPVTGISYAEGCASVMEFYVLLQTLRLAHPFFETFVKAYNGMYFPLKLE